MSACNNLRQYGINYSLTQLHTVDPKSESFKQDLRNFASLCRVLRALKHARVGVIGARPAPFNTVRFSEKLLEQSGISVESLDLSEVFGRIEQLPDSHPKVKENLVKIGYYVPTEGIPSPSLLKMAKFGAIVDSWVEAQELSATAIQCWTSIEKYYGVVPCTLMSMMSNEMLPSACETVIAGVIGM